MARFNIRQLNDESVQHHMPKNLHVTEADSKIKIIGKPTYKFFESPRGDWAVNYGMAIDILTVHIGEKGEKPNNHDKVRVIAKDVLRRYGLNVTEIAKKHKQHKAAAKATVDAVVPELK